MEGKHFEAYTLYKKATCGLGESEHSKALTRLFNKSIEEFCSQEQINEETIQKFSKKIERIFRVKLVWMFSFLAAHELSFVAAAEPDREKAIRLQKEVIFLLLIERNGSEAFEERIEDEIITLRWWMNHANK
jgi:hypothetical protein